MGEVHRLVIQHGHEMARSLVPKDESTVVDIAAAVLSSESNELGLTFSGFCMTCLPHRRLPDDKPWVRSTPGASLLIEPGRVPKTKMPKSDEDYRPVGVPYGPKARLILLFLQTRAVQSKSPVVELGDSLNDWLRRMGGTVGGKTYTAIRDQAERISRCRLQIDYENERVVGFENEGFVRGGITLKPDSRQRDLLPLTVRLSDTFYKALTEHAVPLWEPAIRQLAGKSMALDIYVWLAYRLHVLGAPLTVSWTALQNQFGNPSQSQGHFKPEFRKALKFALAAYEGAKVGEIKSGLRLEPSRPPIPERLIGIR